jgi:hypothetical protein
MKKKVMALVAVSVAILQCGCLFSGCFKKTNEAPEETEVETFGTFGEFGYHGLYLTNYATKDISATAAKKIISTNTSHNLASAYATTTSYTSAGVTPSPSSSLVTYILSDYEMVTVTTKYYDESYVDDSSGEIQYGKVITRTDELKGTNLKNILQENTYVPYSQLVAKNILIFDELIDFMEEENKNFQQSEDSATYPFKTIFSYHTNSTGNVILQTRDYVEIASSVGGGIGCSYRQDTEMVYDAQNKLVKWQTSLGVYSTAPYGVTKQGYMLEIDFNWKLKEN